MKLTTLKLGVLALGLFAFSQGNAQDRQKPDPEKMFTILDTNKDGSISLEEMKARKRKNEVSDEMQEKRFAKIDTNADGAVTLEEFKAGIANRGNKGEGKKKPE